MSYEPLQFIGVPGPFAGSAWDRGLGPGSVLRSVRPAGGGAWRLVSLLVVLKEVAVSQGRVGRVESWPAADP